MGPSVLLVPRSPVRAQAAQVPRPRVAPGGRHGTAHDLAVLAGEDLDDGIDRAHPGPFGQRAVLHVGIAGGPGRGWPDRPRATGRRYAIYRPERSGDEGALVMERSGSRRARRNHPFGSYAAGTSDRRKNVPPRSVGSA
jgi:hypothetical protein